jgi:hypothetical protein
MMVDHITCSFCQARIREHEPDVVLRRRDRVEKYFYHVWSLTRRHVFWDMEGGAA